MLSIYKPERTTSDMPVKNPLNSEMRYGILTNEEGNVVIIHDQDFADTLEWIQYNAVDKAICLIHEDGEMQDFGLDISPQMHKNLLTTQEVLLVLIQNKETKKSQKIPLIIQDY